VASAEEFIEVAPSTENYLRGVVLFGRNVASYKFALARSILELAGHGEEAIPLESLAAPFSAALCSHLRNAPRQATSPSSRFLDTCRQFNEGTISETQLHDATVRLGFNNVIDAFHVVGSGDIPVRFFVDERSTSLKGIRLTSHLLGLAGASAEQALAETEMRWRLVETAWSLEINSSLIAYDDDTGLLIPSTRRKALGSARDALNGYQKGRCFYCYRPIGTTPGSVDQADVDHFFPHVLQRMGFVTNLDQVWNLVLACAPCNRGPSGKSDAIPVINYLSRLSSRNEYLIGSHHPLRETLLLQTGAEPSARRRFLQAMFDLANECQPARWGAAALDDPSF
jgi:hypothetical protein